MLRSQSGGLTIRSALFIGFGLTVALWLFAGYQFTRRLAEVERQTAALSARHMHAQELLSTVRAQVLLGSVYARDVLLDPTPGSASDYRQRLEETNRMVDGALERYEPIVESADELERLDGLRREIQDFRATMLEVLAADSRRGPGEARQLLQGRIAPKREVVIRVSEEVQALNRTTFVRQQAGIAEIYRVSQRRIWWQLGLALAGSVGIAALATLYAGRLESQLRHQRARDARNTEDLQRLSARLVNAQEDERRSIARELHDEVGQVLSAIKVELALAQRAIEGAGGSARLLEDARAIADGALNTVRDLSHLLHPAMLDDLGLPAAVDWYLRGFSKRYGIRVELLQDRMDERLAPETEAAAFRIIQEALTNVAKHARAASCRVHLRRLQQTVLLAIEDDGVGFDAAEAGRGGARRGLGLIGIGERASQLRGTFRLDSAAGTGTKVVVELPAQPRLQVIALDRDTGSAGTGTLRGREARSG